MPLITNISRCSVNDGPGIRTVVYVKGCNLRCKWCHNPEGLSFKKEISYFKEKCISCGRCVDICPNNHIVKDENIIFLRDNCTLCGKCTEICPTSALTMIGKEMTVDEVFAEIKKDVHFFKESGGGVTFSGGECLLYPDFVEDLFVRCHEENISTAIETALFVPWKNIEIILPYTDLIFADFKLATREKHIEYTGFDNDLILSNMKRLLDTDKNVIIRIPLIPNVNDTSEEMSRIVKVIRSFNADKITVELLKYNYMAEKKYSGLDKMYHPFGTRSQSARKLKELSHIFIKNNITVIIPD